MCLQCDLCFEALKIPWESISRRAAERGLVMTRVAVRDFDHADQAAMLPQAVRQLGALLRLNKKVYVHCTAGINRATLTALGYLTFVKKMELDDAHALIKSKRSVAHPYIDCWKTVRSGMLDGHEEEIGEISRALYESRSAPDGGDGSADWFDAEKELISRTFTRLIDIDVQFANGLISASASAMHVHVAEVHGGDVDDAGSGESTQERLDTCNIQMHELRTSIERAAVALQELEANVPAWMEESNGVEG